MPGTYDADTHTWTQTPGVGRNPRDDDAIWEDDEENNFGEDYDYPSESDEDVESESDEEEPPTPPPRLLTQSAAVTRDQRAQATRTEILRILRRS
jgi:hypothetical protein